MLVLTRKCDQEIYIGANQEIKMLILGIERGYVRVGINAEKSIPIVRKEILTP
jgi:carbon storage regulator CsrA